MSVNNSHYVIAIHGGSGVRKQDDMTPELERDYRQTIKQSLTAGHTILKTGGSSAMAVEAAIKVMEDSPLFNAGKGASFTSEGTNEMDASIMEGKNLEAGGAATVRGIKNPISLARLIMERSPYVLLAGEGARKFGEENGLETADDEYFYTDLRWQILQKRLKNKIPYGHKITPTGFESDADAEFEEHGTVGAVALDRDGNLAAGTSTGGRVTKRPGRIGDSPIVGAGTYANNKTCAVSTTGLGECHMRISSARLVGLIMHYEKLSVQEAVDRVIREELVRIGGGGGAVALDSRGNVGMSFTGKGMYRGSMITDKEAYVAIYDK